MEVDSSCNLANLLEVLNAPSLDFAHLLEASVLGCTHCNFAHPLEVAVQGYTHCNFANLLEVPNLIESKLL